MFNENKIDKISVRTKYGLKADDFVIIFFGRMDYTKGVDLLIDAFLKIKSDKVKLLIVGAKWFSEKQKSDYGIELIKKVEIVKDIVIFTGYVDHKELSFLFKSADLSVVPLRCNGAAPLSPIEAQMCGLEVVALANGGIPEYILNKDNLTNPNGDVIEELYKRLVYYIQ